MHRKALPYMAVAQGAGNRSNSVVQMAWQGYHGDTSKMFMVGSVSEKAQELCRITKHALDEAIKICGPGVPVREVGKVRVAAAAFTAQRSYLVINIAVVNQSACT